MLKIEIPDELGEISQVFENSDSDKAIIIIPQKAIDRYNYEKGICRILEYLAKNYNLKLAMPEGAEGKLDVTWFKAFQNGEIKAKVSDDFMKKGEITGLEHLMMTTDYPIEGWGIEDRTIWLESAQLLTTAQSTIEHFLIAVDRIKHLIFSLREKTSDPSLDLDLTIQKYERREMEINNYFFYLDQKAINIGIDLKTEYPDFYQTIESFRNPWGHVYQAQARALREAFLNISGQSKSSEEEEKTLSPKEVITQLAFSEDETKLVKELRLRLCDNENHRELANLYGNIDILVNLTHMQGTPYQFSEFKKKRYEFSSQYFQEVLSKYGIILTEEDILALDAHVPIMEKFYELTRQRHLHYVNKSIEYMDGTGNDLGVMLIMGFNMLGILNLLKQKEISYYVITVNEVESGETAKSNDNATKAYINQLGGYPSNKSTKGIISLNEEVSMRKLFSKYTDDFIVVRDISKGAYKRTVQLRNPKTGELLALKIVDINRLSTRAREHLQIRGYNNPVDAFIDESRRMEMLNQLQNPHISTMLCSGLDDSGFLYFFLENYSERTLNDYVEENHPLPYALIEDIALQLADALAAIHKYYYHGDLKLDNILFRNGVVCITDLDLASSMPDTEGEKYKIPHAQNKAPEIFNGHELDETCDVWAFGVNIFYLRNNKMPFPHDFKGSPQQWHKLRIEQRKKYEMNVLRHIEDAYFYSNVMRDIDKKFNPALAKVVKGCLEKNPIKRIPNGSILLTELEKAKREESRSRKKDK